MELWKDLIHVIISFYVLLPLAILFIILFLQALSKTLTVDELFYLREQFALLEPKNGSITSENIKTVGLPLPSPIFQKMG